MTEESFESAGLLAGNIPVSLLAASRGTRSPVDTVQCLSHNVPGLDVWDYREAPVLLRQVAVQRLEKALYHGKVEGRAGAPKVSLLGMPCSMKSFRALRTVSSSCIRGP